MEDKQYYIPEIEDLFIGYECKKDMNYPKEIYTSNKQLYEFINKQQPDFQPYIIENLLYKDNNLKDLIRTPYLTKEDIEKEGWKFTGKSIDIWFSKEGVFNMGTFRVYKIIMHYNLEDHKMFIYAEDQGSEYDLFKGECKSINEFRKICKWLNIK